MALIGGAGAVFASFVADASFSNSVNLGALLVAGLIIIIAGFFAMRDRLANNQIAGWRGNFEAMKVRAEEFEKELREAREVIGSQRLVIQQLEALPNLERVLKMMNHSTERMLEHQTRLHEENLAVRAKQHQEIMQRFDELEAA